MPITARRRKARAQRERAEGALRILASDISRRVIRAGKIAAARSGLALKRCDLVELREDVAAVFRNSGPARARAFAKQSMAGLIAMARSRRRMRSTRAPAIAARLPFVAPTGARNPLNDRPRSSRAPRRARAKSAMPSTREEEFAELEELARQLFGKDLPERFTAALRSTLARAGLGKTIDALNALAAERKDTQRGLKTPRSAAAHRGAAARPTRRRTFHPPTGKNNPLN